MANSDTVICTYRVRQDAEMAFAALLRGHTSTLRALGFVTDDASQVFRSAADPPAFVEVFTWVEGGFAVAHEHPDVLAMWERMGECLESRDGLPMWEFPHFRRVSLDA